MSDKPSKDKPIELKVETMPNPRPPELGRALLKAIRAVAERRAESEENR